MPVSGELLITNKWPGAINCTCSNFGVDSTQLIQDGDNWFLKISAQMLETEEVFWSPDVTNVVVEKRKKAFVYRIITETFQTEARIYLETIKLR